MRLTLIATILLFSQMAFAQHEHHKALPEVPKGNEESAKDVLNQATERINQKSTGRTVTYHLYITDTIVNYTGVEKRGIAINGSIPAPTLEFTEGDTAEIFVHNELDEETSIHWHGIILPYTEDGVPYLTTAPIKKHSIHRFYFPIVQNGTYWYHSHTELQEQIGMYGALILHKREESKIPEEVLILSEWTDEKPYEVHRSLHAATDWYGIKKGATQSYLEAIQAGHFKTKITNEWKRMLAMDVSDVYYDRFLINGKSEAQTKAYEKGDKVRLRIINGGASTYFWLRYAGGKITVVANDGEDVEPVEVDRLIIAIAETYDVIVTIPADSTSFEFVATSEDRTRQTSLWLGQGIKQLISPMGRLKYFEGMKMMNEMTKLNGNLVDMGMEMTNQKMDMNTVMYPEITGEPEKKRRKKSKKDGSSMDHSGMNHTTTSADIVTLNYSMLRSPKKTTLPDAPTKTMRFELTGNMNRYVWTIDNKTVSEADKILIKKGENVRIIIYNNSMMRHPMHLHGHFFRVLNGQGDYAPLKNVLDIMPTETDTIEFAATESGDWFFHCHVLYHMMSGMGRVFSYEGTPPNPQLPNPKKAQRKFFSDDREFHLMAQVGIETNGSDGEIMYGNTRWFLQTEWRLGINAHHGVESESHIGRYFGKNQFLRAFVGWDFRWRRTNEGEVERNIFQQKNTSNGRVVAVVGVQYVLPLLIVADLHVDHTGNVRLQLMREDIPITSRLRMNLMVNSDLEYMVGLRYIMTKYVGLSAHYDSDMGFGAGLTFTY